MLKGFMRLAACTASGAAFLALTGCGGNAPDDGYSAPPPSSYDRGAAAPTLMGQTAPTRAAPDGLAGGPGGFAGMAPVPNPGDLSKADRVKVYGHRYDYLPEPKGQTGGISASGPRFQLVTRRKADGTLQISMRPVANPEDMTAAERRQVYGNRYAPRAVAAAPRRTWRAAAAPAPVVKPVAVKPAPRPVAVAPLKPTAPAPVIAPAVAVAPAPVAPKPSPVQQLQAAVSAGINRGATLSTPADLKAGKEADVVLSLPGDLLAMVQEQAAKLGLGKAAKKVNAYANLKGDGYAINPLGQQTAPVAAGKPTTFTWKVKPTEGDKTPLTADYGLELNGAKPKTAFSVGSLQEAVAAPVEAAKSTAKGFKLPKISLPKITLPSIKMPSLKALAFPWVPDHLPLVGAVARENVVGGALALLALILLVVLARGASAGRTRAERRRKFRTMQDYGVNEQEHDAHPVTAASQGYVNPMVAAAGAAGGYALASHGHDDHGHGHDDHEKGHDDHAHGGHDDHGHGHDDHGHGHDDHAAHHTSHDAHGHDDHGHGHDDHAAGHGHDDHGHGHGHDDHAAGHDDHGHGAHHTASASHGHDDHGQGHDDHAAPGHGHDDGHGHGHEAPAQGHDDHGHDGHHTALTSHGHDDHAGHDDHRHGEGHGDGHGHDDGHGHGHDDHGHGPAQHISNPGHDDHGHGHDDHGHKADDHGHGHDDHAHGHGHDEHHKEPAHAH